MDNTEKLAYNAGQMKGQAEVKGSAMVDRASETAQSAKESVQEAGAQAQVKAQNAVEAVKDATGMKK